MKIGLTENAWTRWEMTNILIAGRCAPDFLVRFFPPDAQELLVSGLVQRCRQDRFHILQQVRMCRKGRSMFEIRGALVCVPCYHNRPNLSKPAPDNGNDKPGRKAYAGTVAALELLQDAHYRVQASSEMAAFEDACHEMSEILENCLGTRSDPHACHEI